MRSGPQSLAYGEWKADRTGNFHFANLFRDLYSSQPNSSLWSYFVYKCAVYNFIWKKTPLIWSWVWKSLLGDTLETAGHLFRGRTNSRLLTKEPAGWVQWGPLLVKMNVLQPTLLLKWTLLTANCSLSCQTLKVPLFIHMQHSALAFWVFISLAFYPGLFNLTANNSKRDHQSTPQATLLWRALKYLPLVGIGQTKEKTRVDAIDLALREIIFTQLNDMFWFCLKDIPRKTCEWIN